MIKRKIAAIIVTFNRVALLKSCLDSVGKQTYSPIAVYVVDNASTDGTDTWIRENGYDGVKSGIEFRYIRLAENIGGSGGFYTGMKAAHEANDQFDAFWLLDDDGMPDAPQLEKLVAHLTERDYLSPIVVAKEDQSKIAFGNHPQVEEYIKTADSKGLINNVAYPFNGVLYSRKLVEKVGYPLKDMFIWGDEVNYHWRCKDNGFDPAVVIDAIHVHPADRQPQMTILRKYKVVVPPQDWKLYCYVRNKIYNIQTSPSYRELMKRGALHTFIEYSIYFTFYSFNWNKLWIVYKAMWDGWRKDLSRLGEYRK